MSRLLIEMVVLAGFIAAPPAAAAERSFISGIAGTNPADSRNQARTYFNMSKIRALLERLERGAMSEAEIQAALVGSEASIDDLLRTRILRRTPSGFVIGFNYFTAADMRLIHASAERLVPSLVGAYRAHSVEFDRIFRRYGVKSVDQKALATVVLAGFALNWDALETTARDGFRRPEFVAGQGWRYSFFAAEEQRDYSLRGFVWGSSSIFADSDNFDTSPVDFVFSSFGDPSSDPRVNFPDLFYLPPEQLPKGVQMAILRVGARSETYAGFEFKDVLGVSRARSIGPILFALRAAPRSKSELNRLIDISDRKGGSAIVDLLVAAKYARSRGDGKYELTSVVLDRRDAPMIGAALKLHRQILGEWVRTIYPEAKTELSSITAVRQGVPFESAFTQIWHEYFGLATRQLAQAGVILDLNAPASPYRGSIPVLWRRSIYDLKLG